MKKSPKNQLATKSKPKHPLNFHIKSDQNGNLNESGVTTTTSSISSNIRNNYIYSNNKTPQKKEYQIPLKTTKSVSPDNSIPRNKIYTKGTIKKNVFNKNENNNNIQAQNKNNLNEINKHKRTNTQISMEQLSNIQNNSNNLNNENYYLKTHNNDDVQFPSNDLNSNININNDIYNNNNSNSDNESQSKKLKNYYESTKSMNKHINKNQNNLIPNFEYQLNKSNGYYSENEKTEKSAILNIEELLMVEEKLSAIIDCIQNCRPCAEECFEFLTSYYNTQLINIIEKYFIKEEFMKLIHISMNINIYTTILCYMISNTENIFYQFRLKLGELINLNHKIFILISKYFVNKILEHNMWVDTLSKLVHQYDPINKNTLQILNEINVYINILFKNIPQIIQLYQRPELIFIYSQLDRLSSKELIEIYREKIYQNLNQNGSLFAASSYFLSHKINNNNIPIPFLEKKNPNKIYTLVLDLDETLIHFKMNPNNDSSGKILIRPYLHKFLEEIKNYYELVLFTSATQDYADPIINAIENGNHYFDYRLYRIHTTIIDNDFVKDLSKLGRDLNKTIIVDNMPQNFKKQPGNGINIRPFWGKDNDDRALLDLLVILKEIVIKNMNVINALQYFKEDIISRVTSNVYMRSNFN